MTKNTPNSKIIAGCLLVLTAIAVAVTLHHLQSVMLPFVIAIFTTYLISPLVDFGESRLRLPRGVSLGATFLFTTILLGGFCLLLVSNIGGVLQDANQYRDRIISIISNVVSTLNSMGVSVDQQAVQDILRKLPVVSIFRSAVGGVTGALGMGMFACIFLLFLMTGSRSSQNLKGVYAEIDASIRRYIAAKLGISGVTAILTWIVLGLPGVELAFLLAALTFILNFIPTIGSILAVALPIPILILQFENPFAIGGIVALLAIIQFTIGNVVEPKLMGQSLDLHPVTILLSLTLWGLIWGPLGMVLSVPIMATLKIALGRIDTTKSIAELMAGRLPDLK